MTVSGADSVRVRVQLYERCFRRKPVKRVLADEVHEASRTTPAAHSVMLRTKRAICRTTATCIWGVSDPLQAGTDGRVAEGRYAPKDPHCC